MMRGFAALMLIVLGLTVLDIVVVETVYRPTSDWVNIWKYHYIYWVLIVALPLVASYFTKSLMPLLVWVLFFFGVEDTLFYALQGYLPKTFWGVNIAAVFYEPGVFTVLVLNIVGLAAAIMLGVVYAKSFHQRVNAGGF